MGDRTWDGTNILTFILILERSRTALWRLIDATAKSSSSLNTYPIPDFFGPAAMQRETFSRARNILGIRILPRAPTLQTYLFWPIGFNQPRELAQYSSDSRFFWSSCNATCYIFTCAKKKIGSYLVAVNPFACRSRNPFAAFSSGLFFFCGRGHRRVDRRRFDGERGDERRERLLARHRAASCPSDAAPVRPASRGVLSRPASRVGGAPGARGARATRAHARRV